MALLIGLDIGGTKLLVGAADENGTVKRRGTCPTPLNYEAGIEALLALVDEVAQGEPIAAFGAAAGGPLDSKRGIISPLHQPEWNNVPLKAMFESRYGCPLVVEVDTDAAAIAEYQFGHSKADRLMYITLSTGTGGGFLIDGALYRGTGGWHPEFGHQTIYARCSHPERVVCDCGASGCLEALVSGKGIRRIYGKPAEQLDDAEWAEVGYNLGQGMRNAAVYYAPDVIVLGGGVAVGGGERLLGPARETLQSDLKLVPVPGVVLSDLGYETALYGAIALAQRAAGIAA